MGVEFSPKYGTDSLTKKDLGSAHFVHESHFQLDCKFKCES
jgi:hypothetical protein